MHFRCGRLSDEKVPVRCCTFGFGSRVGANAGGEPSEGSDHFTGRLDGVRDSAIVDDFYSDFPLSAPVSTFATPPVGKVSPGGLMCASAVQIAEGIEPPAEISLRTLNAFQNQIPRNMRPNSTHLRFNCSGSSGPGNIRLHLDVNGKRERKNAKEDRLCRDVNECYGQQSSSVDVC